MKSTTQTAPLNPGRAYALLLNNLCIDLHIPVDVSKHLCGLARSRSYASLVKEAGDIASTVYGDAADHFRYNQLASFISKVPFVGKGLDPRTTALRSFAGSEHRMRRCNQKFRLLGKKLAGHTPFIDRQYRSAQFVYRAREIIAEILGPLNLREVYGECYMGDGSAVGTHGSRTHIIEKIRNLTCTPSAERYLRGAVWSNPHLRLAAIQCPPVSHRYPDFQRKRLDEWFATSLEIVTYNEVSFVPKNAKTERSIALEPSGNGLLQLGAGWCIANRLRRVNINIQDQKNNQLFALFGSECYWYTGAISTIDLKAASDSISIELVRMLLPPDWWIFLNSIRSPSYRINGGPETRYEKFASMGNGFCFPLETLIFYAVCKTAIEETGDTLLAVYGDDIALPKGAALLAIERLRWCGFRTNVDKTFVHGQFRESCGADYFGGSDVRPFVLDFMPQTYVDIVKIANGLQARGRSFPATLNACMEITPKEHLLLKPWPTGADDDAILVPMDIFMGNCSAMRWDRDRHTWNFKVWRSESDQDDDYVLSPADETLALHHGSTPGRVRYRKGAAKADDREHSLGRPVLPLRFTARTRRQWYLPALQQPPLH